MRLLFVTTNFPLPAYGGEQLLAVETLRSLQDTCEVHILAPETPHSRDPRTLFEQAGLKVTPHLYRFDPLGISPCRKLTLAAGAVLTGSSYLASTWTEHLRRPLPEAVRRIRTKYQFDVIHCEWMHTAAAIAPLALPCLVRTLDVHFWCVMEHLSKTRSINLPKLWFLRRDAHRFRRFECALLQSSRAAVAISAEDGKLLRDEGVRHVRIIPPPISVRPTPDGDEAADTPCRVLFLGRLDIPINKEGFYLFVNAIWPKVRARYRAHAEVTFAGGRPDPAMLRTASLVGINVRVWPDPREGNALLRAASLLVNPVNAGTGVKMKTLEGLSRGKAVLGFAPAFRGIPVEHERHAIIATSPDEFASWLERLIADSDLRRALGRAAQELVASHFAPRRMAEHLMEAYATV